MTNTQPDSQIVLKACPFCGAGFKQVFGVDDLWSHPYNLCLLGGRQASAAVWNTRTLPTGDGWEEIASAPKDGSTIIGRGPDHGRGPRQHMALVYWDADRHEPGWYDRAEAEAAYAYLTHWCRVSIPSLAPPAQNGDNHG